jgi:molybdenum cofactor cytidylyltransferase
VNISENTVAIVLAAGKSERLGEPKALLNCGKKTLIKFIVDRLESLNLKVVVVTNTDIKKSISKSLDSTKAILVIPNDVSHRTGNLLAGLEVCKEPQRVLVVPVDRPGWSLSTLKLLLSMNETSCPEYNGKGGHPLLICKKDLELLLKSTRDTPLNSIFETQRINVNDSNLHLNIDLQEDVFLLKKFIENIES